MPDRTKIEVPEISYRQETIRAEDVDAEARTIDLAFSSEHPVHRYFGWEVLDHDPASVRLERLKNRGPVLVDHSTRDHVGVVESVTLSDRRGRAKVRFGKSARAEEVFADVADGIRSHVSVGYAIHKVRLEESDAEGDDTYRVVDWEPLEISLVAVPADPTVGVGRGATRSIPVHSPAGKPGTAAEGDRTMPDTRDANTETRTQPAAPAEPKVDADKIRGEALKAERERIAEITKIGEEHALGDLARKAIEDGTELHEFRAAALKAVAARSGRDLDLRPAGDDPNIGMSERELEQYSLLRAMRHLLDPTNQAFAKAAGFEIEASRAAIDKRGHGVQGSGNGLAIPADILRAPVVLSPETLRMLRINPAQLQRDMTAGTASQGGNMVGTNLLAASFIELLRNRAVTMRAGAITLGGLTGNIAIPRQTGGATAYWVSEGEDVTESTPAIGQLALTPKTVGAYTEFTRQLMMQSSIDVEMFVRGDLAATLGLAIDLAAVYGTGADGQPTGVTATSGINTKDFAAAMPTFAEVVDMETLVAADNADFGTLAYVTDPTVRGALKTTDKGTDTGQFVWSNRADGEGEVNGYRALVSNQVTAEDVIFGNWSDLIVAMWGGLDILVNPYAKDTSGGVRVTALQSMDIGVRHAESFCWGNDAQ